MIAYLLDTNVASHVIRGDRPEISGKLASLPLSSIGISAVTEGELLYGLAKRGYPERWTKLVREFLIRVDIRPWDGDAAKAYGDLRAGTEAKGVGLSALDMMIAAHAIALDATLVTRDKAFGRILGLLKVEDWGSPST